MRLWSHYLDLTIDQRFGQFRGDEIGDIRTQRMEANDEVCEKNVSAQDKSNLIIITDEKEGCLSPKLIGGCKRQRSSEMRMRLTSRSTRPRMVWRNPTLLCATH